MVRGNWQKRVETADARRKEAKQKKMKAEDKRVYKAMAQKTLNLLDKHMDAIRRRSSGGNDGDPTSRKWAVHIWTDSFPSESPPFLDVVAADEGKSSRKARASSVDELNIKSTPKGKSAGKGRGRSGSFQEVGKKKVHPRSHQADAPSQDESKSMAPLLCKSQFFEGKCADAGGKRGGCRCVHFNNKQVKTLAAVLASTNNSSQSNAKVALEKAEEACEANTSSELIDYSPGSMEIVYYMTTILPENIGESGQEEPQDTPSSNTISDLLTEKLTTNSCSIASIVYMALSSPFKNVLIYDRNQDGLVIDDFGTDVLGPATTETTYGDDGKGSADLIQAQHLPIAILEHILAYLEAPGVAAATQVCTAWRREISHASPNMWKHLLLQRNWPFPANTPVPVEKTNTNELSDSMQDSELSQSMAKCLREEFQKHYSVYRDMKGVQTALTALLTKKSCHEREMTYQSFSARRGAPQAPNNCVAVEIWGPNQVLAAYSNDCTLRLFQAVPRGGIQNDSNGRQEEKSCRELVCQTIDPYNRTKKKSCFMEAMGLDEDVVGCLLNVTDEINDCKSPHILVTIKRDDLLIVDFSNDGAGKISEPEEGSLHVIDVQQAVLNYILSLDHVDHRLLRLHDFLALGGAEDEIEFIVSQSMAACGYGRFMLEVAISIPFEDDDENHDDDLERDMQLLDRKLFLFSSSVVAIVWMGESNPPNEPLRPRLEDMTLSCFRRTMPGSGTRSSCSVAAVSHVFAPLVMGCEIDFSGNIESNFAVGSSEWSQTERVLEDGWTVRLDDRRPIVVTLTDVVVGDTLTRVVEENNNERKYKSHVTFYSRYAPVNQNDEPIFKLSIGENCMIDRMVGVREDYIVLLVRFFAEDGYPAESNGGHWGNALERAARVFAINIHVPSRREIERCCLYEDFGWNRLTLAVFGGTYACGVWLKGLIMTGSDVRSVKAATSKTTLVLDDSVGKKTKKGKTRRSKGAGKKDGFARGMSLRG